MHYTEKKHIINVLLHNITVDGTMIIKVLWFSECLINMDIQNGHFFKLLHQAKLYLGKQKYGIQLIIWIMDPLPD